MSAFDLTPRFPPHLLSASGKERTDYFTDVAVSHPKFEVAINKADERSDPSFEERFVLLVGATGTGKSAAQRQLVKRRCDAKRADMEADPFLLPAIGVQAEAPDKGAFDMTTLHVSMLAEMGAFLIDHTVEFKERLAGHVKVTGISFESGRRKNSSEAIKHRNRQNLIVRRVGLCCIDEAGLIFTIGRQPSQAKTRDRLLEQSAKLRSLVNKTPTSLLLAGSYDFFKLAVVTGQLARRTRLVHLEPYGHTREDLLGFCEGLIGLLAHLPALHSIDPIEHSAEICLHTVGCIGIASDLLKETLLTHCKTGRPLDIKLVREHYLSAAAIETIKEEIAAGAAAVNRLLAAPELLDPRDVPASKEGTKEKEAPELKPGDTKPNHRREESDKWT